MTYYIKFEDGSEHELPVWLNTKERVEFCDFVIKMYRREFDVKLKNTSLRLEIMANYILAGTNKGNDRPIITKYKEKKNRFKEVNFSELEQKYDKNG